MNEVELLQATGMKIEEIQQRVIDRIVDTLMTEERSSYDEDSERSYKSTLASDLDRDLRKIIKTTADERVAAIAAGHLVPRMTEMIESTNFMATNQWGEKKAEPLTFREYLVECVGKWMVEQVDQEGRERGNYNYKSEHNVARIAWLVSSNIRSTMHAQIVAMMQNANALLAGGINDAIKVQLERVLGSIKATVEVKAP